MGPTKSVTFTPGDLRVAMFTGMSMVVSKWIITPIKVGCKSCK